MIRLEYIVLISAFLILNSCEKEESTATQRNELKILGEWIWVKSYGGFTGSDLKTPENTGVTKIMTFLNNDTVIIRENGSIVHKTDYFLSKEESILFNETFEFLTINYKLRIPIPDTVITLAMRYIIRELSDTLIIDEDVYDGYGHQYKRNK